jgi:hypothetical protein
MKGVVAKMLKPNILEKIKRLNPPQPIGSYLPDDCIFLLKNINGLVEEQENFQREMAIQSGTHYSAMLPVEYSPQQEYMDLFFATLSESAQTIASHVATVSEKIIAKKGKDVVLVSLARAGTPLGVLIKRYLKQKYGLNRPHYSISIIRDIGIDENALLYILSKHGDNVQFIDGWTGKGVIAKSLQKACFDFDEKYQVHLDDNLAVLSDPGYCASIFGTRDDYLVPSACLNSTVSGLMSRTFYRDDIIGSDDFHGAKYYSQFNNVDVSARFVDTVSKYFPSSKPDLTLVGSEFDCDYSGASQVEKIRLYFGITDTNKVKPGVGETTRVLLRRIPWKILIKGGMEKYLKHVLLLAHDKGIPIEIYNDMNYSCCGLIKDMLNGE